MIALGALFIPEDPCPRTSSWSARAGPRTGFLGNEVQPLPSIPKTICWSNMNYEVEPKGQVATTVLKVEPIRPYKAGFTAPGRAHLGPIPSCRTAVLFWVSQFFFSNGTIIKGDSANLVKQGHKHVLGKTFWWAWACTGNFRSGQALIVGGLGFWWVFSTGPQH